MCTCTPSGSTKPCQHCCQRQGQARTVNRPVNRPDDRTWLQTTGQASTWHLTPSPRFTQSHPHPHPLFLNHASPYPHPPDTHMTMGYACAASMMCRLTRRRCAWPGMRRAAPELQGPRGAWLVMVGNGLCAQYFARPSRPAGAAGTPRPHKDPAFISITPCNSPVPWHAH